MSPLLAGGNTSEVLEKTNVPPGGAAPALSSSAQEVLRASPPGWKFLRMPTAGEAGKGWCKGPRRKVASGQDLLPRPRRLSLSLLTQRSSRVRGPGGAGGSPSAHLPTTMRTSSRCGLGCGDAAAALRVVRGRRGWDAHHAAPCGRSSCRLRDRGRARGSGWSRLDPPVPLLPSGGGGGQSALPGSHRRACFSNSRSKTPTPQTLMDRGGGRRLSSRKAEVPGHTRKGSEGRVTNSSDTGCLTW